MVRFILLNHSALIIKFYCPVFTVCNTDSNIKIIAILPTQRTLFPQ